MIYIKQLQSYIFILKLHAPFLVKLGRKRKHCWLGMKYIAAYLIHYSTSFSILLFICFFACNMNIDSYRWAMSKTICTWMHIDSQCLNFTMRYAHRFIQIGNVRIILFYVLRLTQRGNVRITPSNMFLDSCRQAMFELSSVICTQIHIYGQYPIYPK